MRRLTSLLLFVLIGACASVPDAEKFKNHAAPTVRPDQALVFVYREDLLAYDTKKILIQDGGKSLWLIPNGSVSYAYLAPGKHTLASYAWDIGGTEYTGDFEAGHSYYLKLVFKKFDPKLILMEVAFERVEAVDAQSDMADLRLTNPP